MTQHPDKQHVPRHNKCCVRLDRQENLSAMQQKPPVCHQQYCSQDELDALKFFARPKLALDAVGGTLASRMSDALAEACCPRHHLRKYLNESTL